LFSEVVISSHGPPAVGTTVVRIIAIETLMPPVKQVLGMRVLRLVYTALGTCKEMDETPKMS
jgi:hypothetical protein